MSEPLLPGLRRQLLAVGPHAGAHRVAFRAAISVLVPLLLLWWSDRIEWSIYATFGAFTSLYGRTVVGRLRSGMQARVATYLTLAVGLGTLVGVSPQRAWLAIPVTAAVAALGSLASDAERWHPPGPLFLVFSTAACAAIPSELRDVPIALAVAGASASFAVVVGGLGGWVRRREVAAASLAERQRTSYRASLRWHVLPSALGVLLAGLVATASGIGHPYWAMVSAVVPLVARDFRHQLVRGLHRVVGTMVGLVVAAGLFALDLEGLAVILVVVLLQALAELLVGRNYALALVVITPLALLMVHLAAPAPTSQLLADRGIETVIGVLVGLGVGYMTWVRARGGSPQT